MEYKIVLTSAVAGAMAMGAMGMVANSAHALDIPIGASARTNNNASVDMDGSNDASGGIMARSRTNVNARADVDSDAVDSERARTYDESDSRFNSGVSSHVNADTSAGADENADLRAQMRSGGDDEDRTSTHTDGRVNTGISANANTGLLGLSVDSNTRAGGGISFND